MMTGTKTRSRSRGMTVVAVLVCLVVITLVTGALLKTVLAQREFARGRERRLQAEWLVESGLQRVRARRPKTPRERRPSSPSPSSACRATRCAGRFASRPTIPAMRRGARGNPSRC